MADRIKVEGFVEKIFEKTGNSARGPWTAYSIKVQRASGEVDPRFYQFGFTKPGFSEGDYVQFEADIKDEKAAQFVEGTGKKPKNPPTRPEKPAQQKSYGGGRPGGGGGYKPRPPTESKVFGQIGGNNTEDDIRRMSYTAARSAALDAIALLLAHDALPMTNAKTKGGTAARYDEITAAIDKLTVEYFFDAAGGRKLTSVADAGTKETRVAPLPDAEPSPEPAESDDQAGDEPPPDEPEDKEGDRF